MYCNEPVQESGHQYVGAVLMNAREWGLEIYEPGRYIVADRKRDENADIPPPPNVKTMCTHQQSQRNGGHKAYSCVERGSTARVL